MNLELCHVRVKMPLTWKNQNLVGTHFGGSLYSMVDPFYMLILMHHLGSKYIVWLCTRQISQNPYPIRVLPS
ncbi:translation elongation factor P domain protein [Acinetobacter baumannii 1440750]|nr:translation elongation factor P domain protein [Acinetobacter baumannii 1440750]